MYPRIICHEPRAQEAKLISCRSCADPLEHTFPILPGGLAEHDEDSPARTSEMGAGTVAFCERQVRAPICLIFAPLEARPGLCCRPHATSSRRQVYVNILTGITHQIRITMQSFGHPLVSDDRYLPRDAGAAWSHGVRSRRPLRSELPTVLTTTDQRTLPSECQGCLCLCTWSVL